MDKDIKTKILFGKKRLSLEEIIKECKFLEEQLKDIEIEDKRTSYRLVHAGGIISGRYRIIEYQSPEELTKEERKIYGENGKPLSWAVYLYNKGKFTKDSSGRFKV